MNKISIIFSAHLYGKNGASKVVQSIAENKNYLYKHNIDLVGVYTSDKTKKKQKKFDEDEDIFQNRLKRNTKKFLKKNLFGNILSLYLQYIRNGNKAINNYEVKSDKSEDLMMFHDIFTCYLYLKKYKKNAQKFILVLHTDGETWKMFFSNFPKIKENKYVNKKLKKIEKLIYDQAQKIIFVSRDSNNKFDKLYPLYKHKSTFVHNGINNINGKAITDISRLKLVTVGTLKERKAQDLIIKSIDLIGDTSITLDIIGTGEKYTEYLSYVEKNNLKNQIKFWGARDDVLELLPNFNVFIMSSKDEGLPISIIEAMGVGLPILATDVGGINELIDKNGFLMEPNIESISETIKKINRNKTLIKEMSVESLKIFKNEFEITKMLDKYVEIIQGV